MTFGNQGALWGNAMTWWDHGTGSVWSQPLGEAIAGPRRGQTLELLPSEFTTWAAWLDQHPDSLALDAPAGPSRFDLADFSIVVDFGTEARAYPVPDLRSVGVVNDVVAGVEIAVVVDPDDEDSWAVFSRRLDDTVVELTMVDGEIVDTSSGTAFDPRRGIGSEGDHDGEILDLLPGITAFPKDVETFWPSARFWSA